MNQCWPVEIFTPWFSFSCKCTVPSLRVAYILLSIPDKNKNWKVESNQKINWKFKGGKLGSKSVLKNGKQKRDYYLHFVSVNRPTGQKKHFAEIAMFTWHQQQVANTNNITQDCLFLWFCTHNSTNTRNCRVSVWTQTVTNANQQGKERREGCNHLCKNYYNSQLRETKGN